MKNCQWVEPCRLIVACQEHGPYPHERCLVRCVACAMARSHNLSTIASVAVRSSTAAEQKVRWVQSHTATDQDIPRQQDIGDHKVWGFHCWPAPARRRPRRRRSNGLGTRTQWHHAHYVAGASARKHIIAPGCLPAGASTCKIEKCNLLTTQLYLLPLP